MGYRTIQHVPNHCRTYAMAKSKHDSIVPIRGHGARPLGQRRDWQTYSVQMSGDDVQFVLYKTPVITYSPDNTITINMGGWNSSSTRAFIAHVLGVRCHSYLGQAMLTVGGRTVVMPHGGPLRLQTTEHGMTIKDVMPERYGYKMNRKAANNVRARYKEFADYFRMFINLRTVEYRGKWGHNFPAVSYTIREAAEVLGTEPSSGLGTLTVVKDIAEHLVLRPGERRYSWQHGSPAAWYKEAGEVFFGWITSGDTEQFYKAAMALTVADVTLIVEDKDMDKQQTRDVDYVKDMFPNIVMRWHAEEVLEKVALGESKLPNAKYVGWIQE